MMMNDELKPCPRCQSSTGPRLTDHEEQFMCPCGDGYFVVCSIHYGGCGSSSRYEETAEKAIAAWNTRADADALSRLSDENAQLRGQRDMLSVHVNNMLPLMRQYVTSTYGRVVISAASEYVATIKLEESNG